ncbi:DNA polymerase III subunit delta [Sporosarcina thermotolerans]|uniref:DNA polymerase III subunit delta n=1 Tax=Sporosarcina thermotolerans TaxID=633404 RepID=A0AAW9A744_9BACL|nr:DNA polymerase III subunit delta [Sporosarcina thermotolerans]MDW0117406.1 DNA polymerase III subunit delta [Sporosarcina thermotolerans]WHT47541.1 DNA polymerase III subunit delta [Sporosarcina thermotolerans]
MVNAIWKSISEGKIEPVYLLMGVERHLIDETIKRLIQALPDGEEDAVVRFDLDETPIEAVIEEADTLPFLVERKLVIANNTSFLKAADKTKEKVVHNITLLEEWLSNPSPTATVVFLAPYEKLDGRKKITKLMMQKSTVVEALPLVGRDLTTWIQNEASSFGIKISPEIAQVLIDMTGDSLLALSSELEKIAMYMDGKGEVTKEIVEMLVPRLPEMDVFRLTDAYMNGNIKETIKIYHDLLGNGEEPIMLTSLIAGQIRLMIHVASLAKKGYHQQQIAKTLNVHPYRVKLVMENRSIPKMERLLVILEKLADIDYKLKSTSGKRERVLEIFFMEPLKG